MEIPMPAPVSFRAQAEALAEAIRLAATPSPDGRHVIYPDLDRDILASLKDAFERGREYECAARRVK